MPIDTSLDEDAQKQLKAFLTAQVKKPMSQLTLLEARLVKSENIVTKYRSEADKNRRAELVEKLKPQLLEKIKNSSVTDAIRELEETVAACEEDIMPFARGCRKPPSE